MSNFPTFINMISWWQWLLLAAIPPAIIALYFLKLRREPLEVPSTYLWHRTIEDLHVNSLWQRLRQSILLLLQLLLIFLLMAALVRPGCTGRKLEENRFVFMIDTSASMSSTDVKESRLAEAKRRVRELIDEMTSGDVAMIVEFNDRGVPAAQFTGNRVELRRALGRIQPTNRTTNINEALRLAAGLANPGRIGKAGEDEVVVAEAKPAELFIFTDGKFPEVKNFDLGNLEPKYIIIGEPEPANVGIIAFNVQRNIERPEQLQVFARLENHGTQKATVTTSLMLGDTYLDSNEVTLPAEGGTGGIEFELDEIESGTLKLQIEEEDALAADNVAFATINAPRRARVLVITPRNDALEAVYNTDRAIEAAEVSFTTPDYLTKKQYQEDATTAAYDLMVFDQCSPTELMPQCNTLFIGRVPPGTEKINVKPDGETPAGGEEETEGEAETDGEGEEPAATPSPDRRKTRWQVGPLQPVPLIIDTDRAHPLMQFIELGNVRIAEATPVHPPPGGTRLIDTDLSPDPGTIVAIAPRGSFEDVVLGFEIYGADEKGERYTNTDWPIRRSFPAFFMNALSYLGGQGGGLSSSAAAANTVQPGKTVTIRTDAPVENVYVTNPAGERSPPINREGQATFTFSNTDPLGIYSVFEGKSKQASQKFAVNLFDSRESNIAPAEILEVGDSEIKGQRVWHPARREWWKLIVLGCLGLLVLEWWIWNRRVYL